MPIPQKRSAFIKKWLHTPNACDNMFANNKNLNKFKTFIKTLTDVINDEKLTGTSTDEIIDWIKYFELDDTENPVPNIGATTIQKSVRHNVESMFEPTTTPPNTKSRSKAATMIALLIRSDPQFAKKNAKAVEMFLQQLFSRYLISNPKDHINCIRACFLIGKCYTNYKCEFKVGKLFETLLRGQHNKSIKQKNFVAKHIFTGLKPFILSVLQHDQKNIGYPPHDNHAAIYHFLQERKAYLFAGNQRTNDLDNNTTQTKVFLQKSKQLNNVLTPLIFDMIVNSLGFATSFTNNVNNTPFHIYDIPDKEDLENLLRNEIVPSLPKKYEVINYAKYKFNEPASANDQFPDDLPIIDNAQPDKKPFFLAIAQNPNFTTIDDIKAIENLFSLQSAVDSDIVDCFVEKMSIILRNNITKDINAGNISNDEFHQQINNQKRSVNMECFKILSHIVKNNETKLSPQSKTNFENCKTQLKAWIDKFYKNTNEKVANSIFGFDPQDACKVKYNEKSDELEMADNILFEYIIDNHSDKAMYIAENATKIEAGTLLRMIEKGGQGKSLISRKKLIREANRIVADDAYNYTKWDQDNNKYVQDTKEHFLESVLDYLKIEHSDNYPSNVKILQQLLLQSGTKSDLEVKSDLTDNPIISDVAFLKASSDALNTLSFADKKNKEIYDKEIKQQVDDIYKYVDDNSYLSGYGNNNANSNMLHQLQRKIIDETKSIYENLIKQCDEKIKQITLPSKDLRKKYYTAQNAINDFQNAIKEKEEKSTEGKHIKIDFPEIKEKAKELKEKYKSFNKAFKKELLEQNSDVDKTQIDKIKKLAIDNLRKEQNENLDKLSKYRKFLENNSKDEIEKIQSLNKKYQNAINDIQNYKGNNATEFNAQLLKTKQQLSNEFNNIEESIKTNMEQVAKNKVEIQKQTQKEVNLANANVKDIKAEKEHKKLQTQVSENINAIHQEQNNKTTDGIDVKQDTWFFDAIQGVSCVGGIAVAIAIVATILALSANTALLSLALLPLIAGLGTFFVRKIQHKRETEGINVDSEMKIYEEKFTPTPRPKTPSLQTTPRAKNTNNIPFHQNSQQSILNTTNTSLNNINNDKAPAPPPVHA